MGGRAGGGSVGRERAYHDVSGICIPPPVSAKVCRCLSYQILANSRGPETSFNVKEPIGCADGKIKD